MTAVQIDQLNRLRAGVDGVQIAILNGNPASVQQALDMLAVIVQEAKKALPA